MCKEWNEPASHVMSHICIMLIAWRQGKWANKHGCRGSCKQATSRGSRGNKQRGGDAWG